MKELSVEEKITEIKNTNTYQDVKNAWFPPYYEKEYYFISYSHKDYKLVYESLYRLQSGEKRLNLWYDHNLTPGRDWEVEARRYIYDFNCKGVIFFLSENAVLSQSIHKEIEFVKNSGKSYLSINLPCEKIEGHIGEYLSAVQMLKLLKQQGCKIENYEDKSAVLNETFNDKITFLPFNEDIESQIEKILSLKRQPLLNINKDTGTVTSISDINVLEIKKEDFFCKDLIYYDIEKNCYAITIGDCAFANCRQLSRVELPESIGIIGNSIGRFVFYNCVNLKEISLPKKLESIGTEAFSGCNSLKNIYIPANTRLIGERAFAGCKSLENIIVDSYNKEYFSQDGILYNKNKTEIIHIPQAIKGEVIIPYNINSISTEAFSDCKNLESIIIPNSVVSIGQEAFCGCSSLKRIIIPNSVVSIGQEAFSVCSSLESIAVDANNKNYSSQDGVLYNKNKTMLICCPATKTSVIIPNSVTYIGDWAFGDCTSLKDIFYKGTKWQWKVINKHKWCDINTSDYIVHCTDGDLKKGEF